jgi:hypothetical protein
MGEVRHVGSVQRMGTGAMLMVWVVLRAEGGSLGGKGGLYGCGSCHDRGVIHPLESFAYPCTYPDQPLFLPVHCIAF